MITLNQHCSTVIFFCTFYIDPIELKTQLENLRSYRSHINYIGHQISFVLFCVFSFFQGTLNQPEDNRCINLVLQRHNFLSYILQKLRLWRSHINISHQISLVLFCFKETLNKMEANDCIKSALRRSIFYILQELYSQRSNINIGNQISFVLFRFKETPNELEANDCIKSALRRPN